MNTYAAVILAAGRGSRFSAAGGQGASKLVATHQGDALVRHVARAALASRATPVIVVTGHAQAEIEAALNGLEIRTVHNTAFRNGLASTLRCGLDAVPADARGVVVLLADMPAVMPATIDALIARAAASPPVDAVIPVRGGRRGNPVLLAHTLFPRLRTLTGDEGARRILADGAAVVAEIEQPASIFTDVDRPSDLATLQAQPPSTPPFVADRE